MIPGHSQKIVHLLISQITYTHYHLSICSDPSRSPSSNLSQLDNPPLSTSSRPRIPSFDDGQRSPLQPYLNPHYRPCSYGCCPLCNVSAFAPLRRTSALSCSRSSPLLLPYAVHQNDSPTSPLVGPLEPPIPGPLIPIPGLPESEPSWP